MADSVLPGNHYRLYRMASGSPEFVCMATNLSHNETKDMDKALVDDCDDPTARSTMVSTPRSVAFTISGGGKAKMAHYEAMKADFDSDDAVPYRIVADPTDGEGAGYWQGDVHITSLQFNKQNSGMVDFSFQMEGEGKLAFIAT